MPAAPVRVEEHAFHRWLARTLRGPRRGRLPLGDDAAALPLGNGRVALLTTDALVEWTHFLPASPPGLIGAAAANASLSDLAAKGGRPVALLLDLLLPEETTEAWARAVVRGADRAMSRYDAGVVGGDTKPSDERAVIGTAFGIGRADRTGPHSAARPGDVLATTGTVGRGGVAYRTFTEAGPTDRAALAGLLRIDPRVAEGAALAGLAHAVVDSSDGISEAVRRLAEASGVRVSVREAALPLARGIVRGPTGEVPSIAYFGGDYELVAAIPARRWAGASRAVAAAGGSLTQIGAVERGTGTVLVTADGRRPMPPRGYRPEASRRAPPARV